MGKNQPYRSLGVQAPRALGSSRESRFLHVTLSLQETCGIGEQVSPKFKEGL